MHFGLIWVFIEKLGASLLSVAVFFVYAKFLTTAEMGVAVMILSITQFLAGLISAFFEDVLVQKKELDERDLDTSFWVGIFVSLGVMAATALGFWFWAKESGSHIFPLAMFASLEILATNVMTTYVAQLRRSGHFKILAFRVLLGRIGGSLLGLVCIFANLGPWSIIVQSVTGILLQCVILVAAVRSVPGFDICLSLLRKNLSFGSLIASQRLLWDLLVRVTPLSAGIVGGASMAGVVGFAWRIVELPRSAISSGLYSYLLPLLSRYQHNQQEMAVQFVKITGIISFFVTPLFLGLYEVTPYLITGIFGQKWVDTIPLIQLFTLAALFSSYRIPAYIALNASGHPGKTLILDIVSIALTILIMFVFGSVGAWVMGAAHLFRFFVSLPKGISLIKSVLGLSVSQQFMPMLKYAIPGLVMFDVLVLLRYFAPYFDLNYSAGIMMGADICLGFLVFSVLSYFFFREDLRTWKAGMKS